MKRTFGTYSYHQITSKSWMILQSAWTISSVNDVQERRSLGTVPDFGLSKRDGDHHHHKGAPLLQLNETDLLTDHAPTPPSYYTIDWDDVEGHESRHGTLMILHGIFMSLAFFVSLPIGWFRNDFRMARGSITWFWFVGIALRSVKHAAHGLATLSFYGFCALGCASSGLYRKLTPNM